MSSYSAKVAWPVTMIFLGAGDGCRDYLWTCSGRVMASEWAVILPRQRMNLNSVAARPLPTPAASGRRSSNFSYADLDESS